MRRRILPLKIFWFTKRSPKMIRYYQNKPKHLLSCFVTKLRIVRYVENALIVSSETCKEVLTQLVSTSNKRPSSGEMKIDLKRVGIYTEIDLTL